MKNKKIKLALNFFLIILLFLSQTGIVQAINVGNVNKIMGVKTPPDFLDSILGDLGVDKNELKSNVQTFNVSSSKKTPPQVSLFFSPANPSEGEKITATASPTYFLNDPKDLYYTWFLKTANCYDEDSDGSDYKDEFELDDDFEKCDLNNDDEVDIEDYKIKATRIIANGGFIISSNDIYKTSKDNDGYEAFSGGNDQRGKIGHCYIHDTESGKEYEIDCGSGKDRHLFPYAEYENFTDHNGDRIDLDEETGDNDFGRDEEKFWHTDPNSNDTANRGNPDEATIVGLGITSFTWNYQKGDKIGVVVEGVSTEPSPTQDSSYKTMWAMNEGDYELNADFKDNTYPKTSRNTISTTVNDDVITTTLIIEETVQEIDGGEDSIVNGIATIKQTVTLHEVVVNSSDHTIIISDDIVEETIEGETDDVFNPIITYFTEDFSIEDFEFNDGELEKPSDLNEFLYDSLVSPQENTAGSNKLEINLSFYPNNPINDPAGISGDGDLLTIHSTVSNAKDTNYLQYDWKVYSGVDISSDSWTILLKPELLESTQSVGLGIDTFKFKLGFSDPDAVKFLKVVLTVTENTGEDHPRKNTQDVIIPINSTTEKIKVSNALMTELTDPEEDPLNLSRVKLSPEEDEICNSTNLEKALCPVAKNQIIAVSVAIPDTTNPDFLWTIDGKPLSYPYCFFEGCKEEKQTNVAYFPILKEVGEQYSINLTATNEKGEKINLTRNFQVVDPEITIISDDPDTCEQNALGYYFDVNGEAFPDLSQLNFHAYIDSPIKLRASATGFSVSLENLSWNVDNKSISSSNASDYGFTIDSSGVLTLPPKEIQESYNIAVGTLYTQNKLTKKALNAIWGVTYNQFYEKTISDDAIITMQEPKEKSAQIKPKKIFATIYSSTPAYLAFLLRIVLTISLILFVTKLIFSFSPETISREE